MSEDMNKEFNIPKNATIQYVDGDYQHNGKSGLFIKTDKGNIKLMIGDVQDCCETFGHLFFETPDNVDDFIGAKILAVKEIDVNLTEQIGKDYGERSESQLRIVTDKGDIQYAIYNEHNGYYAHEAISKVFDELDQFSL